MPRPLEGEAGTPVVTAEASLKRGLNLPLLVLYGLGVTIGAGIYVLVGEVGAAAAHHAPISFLVAGIVISFSALSFAELATRFPASAGEAVYVEAGFSSRRLGLIVGLAVAGAGLVSSATIALGAAAYIRMLVDLPEALVIVVIIVALTLVAAWGIVESVTVAGLMTLAEIGGLVAVVGGAVAADPGLIERLPRVVEFEALSAVDGILAGAVLAFFAFIGFEDMVNVVEEVENPGQTMPRAIVITLVVSIALYLSVAAVTVLVLTPEELAGSSAPLALVAERGAGLGATAISIIAVVATLNGIVVQMVMASRVLYGLSARGSLPRLLGTIHPATRTPLVATGLVGILILALALAFPIGVLAARTSQIALSIFAVVDVALVVIKLRERRLPVAAPAQAPAFEVPIIVPILGALSAGTILLLSLAG